MSNILEFFVKMKDMMSGGLVKIASTAQSAFSKVQGHVDKVTGRNKVLTASFEELERKMRETERVIQSSNIPSQIRAARRELAQLQRMQSRHAGNVDRGGSGGGGIFGGLGRSLIPALGVAGIMALGGNAIQQGMGAQARQVSFEVMAGKDQGTALNKDLTKFAQDSIFGNEIFASAQTMMGFGVAAKNVMPTLKMLGDVSMGNADRLGALTLAFSQVQAAGRLTGQDLLQFINAGFNPLQQISERTGLSIGVLKERMEKGAISAKMVQQAFEDATGPGGRFHDMTNKIAQTDFGKWQAFQGQLDAFAVQVGGMLAPILGSLITDYLMPFLEWLQTAAVWLQQNADWIGLVATVLGVLAAGIGIVTGATYAWSTAQAILNTIMAMNPISLVVIAVMALVAALIYAYNKFGAFRGIILGTWEAIKGFGKLLKDYIIDRITGILKGIGGLGQALGLLFEGEFSKAWETAKVAAGDLLGGEANANAVKNAQEMGKNMREAYNQGVAEVAAKSVTGGGMMTPTSATGKSNTDGKTASDISSGGTPSGVAQGIASGGPRTININGVKFADKIEIHSSSNSETIAELEGRMQEMFLRILNSGAAIQ